MKRREVIRLLGAIAAWPLTAGAQQRRAPVIGVLGSPSAEQYADNVRSFRQGLANTGYIEGRDIALEFRWANDRYDRLPELAAELIRAEVSLIAAIGNRQSALAAKAATTTIPIVFAMGADPVESGLVASLNRPGGNITGATQLAGPTVAKRLQVLRDLIPQLKVIGLLVNPTNLVEGTMRAAQDGARALDLAIRVVNVTDERNLDAAVASLARDRVDALNVFPDSLFSTRLAQIAALALEHAIPAIYSEKAFALAGGLVSYGADLTQTHWQAGAYAGRILKGERPADLPVLQPSKFELVINLKTAKTLGIAVPQTLLTLADEVIE